MSQVQASKNVTKKSASNLALAFALLPKHKKEAMCALYAFCREVDDVADSEEHSVEEKRVELKRWREDLQRACQDEEPNIPIVKELKPVIHECDLPTEHLEALIDGMEMDLTKTRYDSWDDLANYCYHVASVVGLLSVKVFGYNHSSLDNYGYHLGQALQLTNILRDVRVDAEKGRIYLPQDLLRKHGVSDDDVLNYRFTPDFRAVAKAVAERARGHYRSASQYVYPDKRRLLVASEMMASVYWRILLKIEKSDYQVLSPKLTKLTKAHKLGILARSAVRYWLNINSSDYGPR